MQDFFLNSEPYVETLIFVSVSWKQYIAQSDQIQIEEPSVITAFSI